MVPEQHDATPDEPIALDPDHFESFVTDHDLVLVDVWAEWCGPCKQMEPAIEEIAALDGVAVGKVDTDEHPDLLSDYRSLVGRVVSSLPALFVFADGECVERTTGARSKTELRELLEPYR